MNNPVGWFEIYVQDMSRAKRFYETVFGVKLDRLEMPGMEMVTFPMSPEGKGASGALIRMEGFESGANSVLVYFSSSDCSVEEGRVVNAGGKIQKSKTSIGQYGFISLVFDTEGNMVGIHSRK